MVLAGVLLPVHCYHHSLTGSGTSDQLFSRGVGTRGEDMSIAVDVFEAKNHS
jgi:hypothetical protein